MVQQALHSNPPTATERFDWLGTVRGIIVAPSATFARLADAQPWRQGIILFLVVSVSSGLLRLLEPTIIAPGADDPQDARLMDVFGSPYFQALTDLIFMPLMFLAATGIVYQIGLRQGGDGPFTRLFTTEVFSAALITLVSAPIDTLGLFFPRGDAPVISAILGVVSFAVAIWGLVLAILSVRASMRLSTGSSVVVVIASLVAVLIFSLLVLFVLGGILSSVLG
jgi:hypothetical protein